MFYKIINLPVYTTDSIQDMIMDAAAAYAGSFLLSDAKLRQGGLKKFDRLSEDGFFILVAVEQQIVNFRADWRT